MIEVIHYEIITFEDDYNKWKKDSKSLSLDYWYPKPQKIDYPQVLEIVVDTVKKEYRFELRKKCWGVVL